jgi:uncharacterized protein
MGSRHVYMDTSAFMAVLNLDDRHHDSARIAWIKILESDSTLICSSYVLVETYALLQNRLGIEAVRAFQRDIAPLLEVVWVKEDLHRVALNALLTANRSNLSLVDCIIFSLMRSLNVIRAFTYDKHFTEQGFQVIQ